jgi:integrase
VFWNVYEPGRIGRRKQKSEWFATQQDAEDFKVRMLAALAQPDLILPVRVQHWRADSVGALAVDWLAHVEGQREAATHHGYQNCVRSYLAPKPGHKRSPGLGDLIVSDATLTPKVVADFETGLYKAGVSLSTRRRVHRAFSAFCSYAVFAGKLNHNPCYSLGRMLRKRGEEDSEPEPNPFTPDEIARIFDHIEACEADWLPYFQFLYDVGVRPGEAAALKWTALDFDRLKVRIELNWSPAGKTDKPPKTHECRTIDMTSLVAERLLQWRPIQRQALLRRVIQQSPYVFTSRRGTRAFQDSHVRLVFGRVMKACGIQGHTLYDFRDSFATSHLVEHWDRKLAWVSHQLGHKHVLTTQRFYYKYRPTTATKGFADEIRNWGK